MLKFNLRNARVVFILLFSLVFISFANAEGSGWELAVFNSYNFPINYSINNQTGSSKVTRLGVDEQWTKTKSGTLETLNGIKINIIPSMFKGQGQITLSNSQVGFSCTISYSQLTIYGANNLSTLEVSKCTNASDVFVSSTKPSSDDKFIMGLTSTLAHIFNQPNINLQRLTLGQIQCIGYDNCVLVGQSDDKMKWVVNTLALQNSLQQFEPLTHQQFLGMHNSIISRNYNGYRNGDFASGQISLSHFDPNHYLSLKQQLDLGVRMIELDFLYNNNSLVLCHNHANKDFNNELCKNNDKLETALTEIANWITQGHQNQLVFLYLDIDQDLGANGLEQLNQKLSVLSSLILNKNDINKLNLPGVVTPTGLPADSLNTAIITSVLHKNIIIYAHDAQLGKYQSPYVFNYADGLLNQDGILHYDGSINEMLSLAAPGNSLTYSKCAELVAAKDIFPRDPNHKTLWAFHEDATGISGSEAKRITPDKIQRSLNCPINIFSLDKLSLKDPRLPALIWSWQEGYPLENGASSAYIDPITHRFKNDNISLSELTGNVLCYSTVKGWKVSHQKCDEGYKFAAPTVSYQMGAVLEMLSRDNITGPISINYKRIDGNNSEWQANDQEEL